MTRFLRAPGSKFTRLSLLSLRSALLLALMPVSLCIATNAAYSQSTNSSIVHSPADIPVKGTIKDSKTEEPLNGVSVRIKGINKGVATDDNGNFSIAAPGEGTLVISYVGYETQEVSVGNRGTLNISLVSSMQTFSNVVVIGYGTVKKSDLTGAVGSVSAKDLTAFPVPNPLLALQGKTPGVRVLQNSGAPGAGISVRIRGANSLLGDNEPLYVVDGIALAGNPNIINTNDIESMEVLKDASATAIYGSRGANGVVLITTKKGKAGRPQVSFDTYYSLQQATKKLDLMNATEFAILANRRAANDGVAPFFTQAQIDVMGEGTDWQDALFRTAPMQSYSVSASGGGENTTYSISANFLGQDGIIVGSKLNRETLRANINQKLSSKFTLTYNAILSNTDHYAINNDNGSKGSTVLSAVLSAPPTIAPRDELGAYNNIQAYTFSPNLLINPLAQALERKDQSNRKYILAGTNLAYEPVKDLVFRTSIGVESSTTRSDVYSPRIIFLTPTGEANVSQDSYMNILNENTLTYNKKIQKNHEFTLLGGVTYQQNRIRGFGTGNITGFLSDNLATNDLSSGSVPGTPGSNSSKWVIFSYLSRVNYSFKGKYLLTSSFRADGSSRFGEGSKWGYFPSVALAWRVSSEDFMKNIPVVSNLKLRASYGETGSTAITPYQTLNTLQSYQVTFNDRTYIGIAPNLTRLANPNLKWETTVQQDVGVDIGFFDNRLNLSADLYVKNTRDLLANIPLAFSLGYTATTGNLGKIRNAGFELGADAIISNRAVKWSFNGSFSMNKSKVLELAGGSDIFSGSLPLPFAANLNLVRVGYPVGVFFGYEEDGLDSTGFVKYKDLDGKAGITTADRSIIGDPNPDFIYNFGSDVNFKNFNLNFQFQGVEGNDIYNVNLSAQTNGFYLGENQLKDVFYNSWTKDNPDPNAKYPRISSTNRFLPTNRYVEDGSFLRLKNLQLGYTLPLSSMNIKWAKVLQVYMSGQNLLTFTKYSWYDPEVNSRASNNSLALGWDNTSYPNTRMFTAGLRATF